MQIEDRQQSTVMLSNSSLQYETVSLHKNQVNHLFRKFFFNINDFKCTKQYITHFLMHDSAQEQVAYSTLPFKVQTTPLDYKLHTDCTVHLQHSTPTWHQETMGQQKTKKTNKKISSIVFNIINNTHQLNAPGLLYIANI